MSSRRENDKSSRGYHHGNLREALVDAALSLIARKGPSGFTVAEAARSAGVSPAAPYRHFKDREALLADVALRGFAEFESKLNAAWNGGKPNPEAALMRTANAYLEFAKANPAYYSAMFEAGLPLDDYREVAKAGDSAFEGLRQAVEALFEEIPREKRPPALMAALHIWAQCHGIASLFGRGDDARRKQPIEPAQLLESSIMIYLRGLGL